MQLLHPSVKSGRFLAAAPFFACGDVAEFLGPFPRSKIPNHPAAANVVALSAEILAAIRSLRALPFVWIVKCRDRAARTYNKHTGSWKQF